MSKARYTLEELKNAVLINKSIAGVLRTLGLRPIGGNYRTINRIISKNSINTEHFTGQGWNAGLKFKPYEGISDDKVFVKDSGYKCSWRLRERFIKKTGKRICHNCGLSEWLGKPIPLKIHSYYVRIAMRLLIIIGEEHI